MKKLTKKQIYNSLKSRWPSWDEAYLKQMVDEVYNAQFTFMEEISKLAWKEPREVK